MSKLGFALPQCIHTISHNLTHTHTYIYIYYTCIKQDEVSGGRMPAYCVAHRRNWKISTPWCKVRRPTKGVWIVQIRRGQFEDFYELTGKLTGLRVEVPAQTFGM